MPRASNASRRLARKRLGRTQSAFDEARDLHAHFVGLLDDDPRETTACRRSRSGSRSAIACTCCSVCPVPAGNTVQPERVRAGLEHRARRREVIGEAVVHEIARAKPRREQRAREPPVVGRGAFRLVDRPRRGEHARRALDVPAASALVANPPNGRLLSEVSSELRLASDGNLRQRRARADRGGIHVGEDARRRARSLAWAIWRARARASCSRSRSSGSRVSSASKCRSLHALAAASRRCAEIAACSCRVSFAITSACER